MVFCNEGMTGPVLKGLMAPIFFAEEGIINKQHAMIINFKTNGVLSRMIIEGI